MSPRIHTLSSGVRVIADPTPGLESLALTVVFKAGARWETPETAGWAHLIEHMVFKGAGGRSAREIAEVIENEGGQINAATGQERTSFQVRCLKGGLPLAMQVLADLVQRPTLDPEELEREKDVVAQEIAEADDAPDDKVFEIAQAKAFGPHALGRPILGTSASLAPATRETLGAFHRGLYAPDRLVVSASGAIDEDELLREAEAAFGAMTPPPLPLATPTTGAFVGGAASEARRLEQAHLVLLVPAIDRHHPDIYAQGVFAEILGGGMSSRLFQEAREERGLAYNIDAYEDTYEDVGLLGIYAGAAVDKAEGAARLAADILKRLATTATDAELARAKAQVKASVFMRRESTLARAEQNAAQLLFYGRLFTSAEIATALDVVTLDDLRRVGARLIDGGRAATAVLGPKKAAGAGRSFAESLAAG